jgi:hypothetical protein
MTTTRDHRAARAVPRRECAGAFLGGLAAQDFAQLYGALAAEARLRALLPSGLREWAGAQAIADRFAGWFGETEEFQLVNVAVGEVGGRLHLHWRIRLRAERLGPGWFTVEQQAYADTGQDGHFARLDLLCTGYLAEADDD